MQNNEDLDKAQQIYDTYKDKSEDDILAEIFKVAAESRDNGSLSDDDIDNFVSTVGFLLNDEQREKLSGVIEKLKSKRR